MDIGSIFLILALLILVALFVSRPFISRSQETVSLTLDPQDHERSSLLAERDRLLNALQELDFDATLGKIPEEDYPAQREAVNAAWCGCLAQAGRDANWRPRAGC